MSYSLSEHYTSRKLLCFAFPSILSVVFTSIYTIVDGIFVSNAAGESAFAALNLIWPVVGVLQAFGFMIGAGGSALISRTLGEENPKLARELFTMLVVFEVLAGICFSALMLLFLRPLAFLLGADAQMIDDCMRYGGILLLFIPFVYLSSSFHSFLLVCARPKAGLYINVGAGILNMILDYVFMIPLQMGIAGAALATGLNWVLAGLLPLVFFTKNASSTLYFCRFSFRVKALVRVLLNGSSEMVTNASVSLIAILYNLSLMFYLGAAGVNAYGIIQYIQFLFLSLFFGFCMAVSPLISYQYGAGNHRELHSLLFKSLLICCMACLSLTVLAELSASFLAGIFVSYSASMMELSVHAIHIFSLCFLFTGLNVFFSSFFTALNNGFVSALLSFFRTFFLQAGCVLLLPRFFGVEGIWWATTVSEFLSLLLSVFFLYRMEKRYRYGPLFLQ